jgi:hypothetical protein
MPSRYLKDQEMLLKARSVLLAAYDLLSDPSRWTQGTVARDHREEAVHVTDPSAQKWCAVGAITRASDEMCLNPWDRERVQALAQELMMRDLKAWEGNDSIPSNNDRIGGYARIMASFTRLLNPVRIQAATARSLAASKGWVTRRMIRQPKPAAEPVMTFGGTLTTTDTSPQRKEIAV